jgi:hypothetical protein
MHPLTAHTSHPALEDGTDTGFRNVGLAKFDGGEIPKRIHTIFNTRRKFEIKYTSLQITNKYLRYYQLHIVLVQGINIIFLDQLPTFEDFLKESTSQESNYSNHRS